MSAVAFDNTMLSILLNPEGKVPNDRATGEPVIFAQERAQAIVLQIQKERRKIVIPTPALAELLTVIGPDAQQYVNMIGRSRVFDIASFDAKCAAELALLNRDTFASHDRKTKLEPYQKIKIDRQIIAICRANGVAEIYTDDRGLSERARMCGVVAIGIADCPIPEGVRQGSFDLQPHEAIPKSEDLGE